MNKIPLYLLVLVALFTSCARYTGGIIGGNPTGDYIEIVKFNDPTLLNKVVCVALEEGQTAPEAGNQFFRGGEYFIPTCFEQTPGEPLFCVEEQPSFFAPKMRYQYGNNYDLCDLASKRKYIALENGWYLCYPYAGLSQCHRYLNVDWADICNVDWDTVSLALDNAYDTEAVVYYHLSEKQIASLTKKATAHFNTRKREQVTIDDVTALFNELIHEGKLEETANGIYHKH